MNYRERGSYARDVHSTQYTSRLGTARVKQEEETDTRVMQQSIVRNMEERNVGTKGKSPKQDLTSAKYLTIELPYRDALTNLTYRLTYGHCGHLNHTIQCHVCTCILSFIT